MDPSYFSICQQSDSDRVVQARKERKAKLRDLIARSKAKSAKDARVVFVLSKHARHSVQEGGRNPQENHHYSQLCGTDLNLDWSIKRMEQKRWALLRNANPGQFLTLAEAHCLRQWFNSLDADGSGEIAIQELADPLLIANIALTEEQTIKLFRTIDADSSGEVDFEEFLAALSLKSKFTHRSGILSLLEDMEQKFGNLIRIETVMNVERRKFILETLFHTSSDDHSQTQPNTRRERIKQQKKYAALRKFVFEKEEIKYKNKAVDPDRSTWWLTYAQKAESTGNSIAQEQNELSCLPAQEKVSSAGYEGWKRSKVSKAREQTLNSLVLPRILPRSAMAQYSCAVVARAGNPKCGYGKSEMTDAQIVVGKIPVGQRQPVNVSQVVHDFSRFLHNRNPY